MRVFVDGHNALAKLKIKGRTHEERRHALLRLVGAVAPKATVFFDARQAPAHIPDTARELGVDVVYCRRREADAAILEAVRESETPGALVVVTDDREVRGRAVQLGAQGLGVGEFFGPRARPTLPADARQLPNLPRFTPKDFGLPDEVDLAKPDLDDDD